MCKFKKRQTVIIKKGFHKGTIGVVSDYYEEDKSYMVSYGKFLLDHNIFNESYLAPTNKYLTISQLIGKYIYGFV